jgi:hypothetical protein
LWRRHASLASCRPLLSTQVAALPATYLDEVMSCSSRVSRLPQRPSSSSAPHRPPPSILCPSAFLVLNHPCIPSHSALFRLIGKIRTQIFGYQKCRVKIFSEENRVSQFKI